MAPRKKYYAVAAGRKRGIYQNWAECEKQVKGFAGARYKSFKTYDEAQAFVGLSSEPRRSAVSKRGTEDGNDSVSKRPRTMLSNAEPLPTLPSVNGPQSNPAPPQTLLRRNVPVGCTAVIHLKIHLMFDGGSRGNPGIAGAGAVLTVTQTPVSFVSETPQVLVWHQTGKIQIREYMPEKGVTNNQAEYHGLCVGLKRAAQEIEDAIAKFRQSQDAMENGKDNDVNDNDTTKVNPNLVAWKVSVFVQGDSQLVLRQVEGCYQCKADKLKPYLSRAKKCLQSLQNIRCGFIEADEKNSMNPYKPKRPPRMIDLDTKLEHVLRSYNSEADALANQAMDAKRSWVTTADEGLHPLDM